MLVLAWLPLYLKLPACVTQLFSGPPALGGQAQFAQKSHGMAPAGTTAPELIPVLFVVVQPTHILPSPSSSHQCRITLPFLHLPCATTLVVAASGRVLYSVGYAEAIMHLACVTD